MEHYKISKLLDNSTLPNFVTRIWIEVNDLSRTQYFVNKNVRFKSPTIRSTWCDYSDAYIAVKERIIV